MRFVLFRRFARRQPLTPGKIRYLASQRLGSYIDFTDCDVLFLYSTGVLNNSDTLK